MPDNDAPPDATEMAKLGLGGPLPVSVDPRILDMDAEIYRVIDQLLACRSMPPVKRAVATHRTHQYLKACEEARAVIVALETDRSSGCVSTNGQGGSR